MALAPHGYVLALWGIVFAVGWVGRRRPSWDPARAGRVFVGGAVAFGVATAVWGSLTVHQSWDEKRAAVPRPQRGHGRSRARTRRTASCPSTPPGTRYWTGHGGVVLVNDPIETVEAVARAYDIRWLVLEPSDTVPAAAAVMAGERPAWLGYPVVETRRFSLFPVCTTPEDDRCETGA